ncbi:MAG: hypothetical protein H6611_05020 [Ignavibacteriales bacterium]|nr:hypothetical protein [Ignavibacteriales bacterium]
MKFKFSILTLLLFASTLLFSQVNEKEPRKKITSPEEFERLYGKIKGTKFNKITGEQTEIKDLVWKMASGYGYEFGQLLAQKFVSDGTP